MRKIVGPDNGTLYAMKVLKKATLKGIILLSKLNLYSIYIFFKF